MQPDEQVVVLDEFLETLHIISVPIEGAGPPLGSKDGYHASDL